MKRVLAALLISIVALTAACGDDDEPEARTDTSDQANHNEADVEFAQAMIPHHEQAVEMAQLAATRAQSSEVKELASQIEAAQDPEIQTMTGWLEDWGESVDGGGGMDHGGGDGMMGDDQMSSLEGATGAEFDRMFLEQMTEHHEGAIAMAETELDEGRFQDALEMAQTIRDTQRQEVQTMETLLANVG